MSKLQGFISYAHADEDYFKLIKEGFRKHGKHSKLIDSDLWQDENILAGAPWHETIQAQVKGCDFAVFLVSSSFLASEYIEAHEFKAFLKRQDEEGFLFFPLLVAPCDFSYWERLASRQFFKPNGKEYGCPELADEFTFGDLVQQNFKTGEVFPNPNRERYLMNALKEIEKALEAYQKQKTINQIKPTVSYFQIKHISEINPIDILETRSKPSQGYRDYYLERPYLDDRLAYNYQHKKHTIITGKPLAGKTRAVLELLNSLENKDVLLLFPELKDIEMGDFQLPDTKAEIIVFFDDFEKYLLLKNLDEALEKTMLKDNVFVLATCRKDRLQEVKFMLDDELHNFDILEIQILNKEEDETIKKEMPDRANQKSDGTAGGYCLPINSMRKKFDSLPAEGLEQEILHACKVLRYWKNMEFDGGYRKQAIKDYCQKRLKIYYQSNREVSPNEWDKAFKLLAQKDLMVQNGETIAVEEIYLDAFILLSAHIMEEEMLQYFPTTINFTKALRKTNGFLKAEGMLERMKLEGVRPDEFTFNSLLIKVPDFATGEEVLKRMKLESVRPDEVTYNTLLSKAPDLSTAEGVLEKMKLEGVRPDEVTFNSLMNKAPDLATAEGVLERMKREGVRPNVVTFSSLLNKAPDFHTAEGVLERMKREGVRPNEFTFSSLLSKAPDLATAEGVLERMKREGLRPDEVTFNSLLSKAPDFPMAEGVLERMKREGLRPDEFTFSSLLSKAPDLSTAEGVLERMKREGVMPDEVTFSSLLSKAPDFPTAEGVLERMKQEGVRPDEVTYYLLIKKTRDFTKAKSLYLEMKSLNISIHKRIPGILMKIAQEEDIQWVWEEFGMSFE